MTCGGPLGALLATGLLSLMGCSACGGTSSNSTSSEFSFFRYLKSTSPEPALIAFSPTNYDPRPEPDHKVPSADSVRRDLEALRPAFDGLILYGYESDVTPTILAEAQRQGYRAVLLGIWNPNSTDEIDGVAKLTERYDGQLALAVCVGNEGIAFNRYTIEQRDAGAEILRNRLGVAIQLPLSTSEPLAGYDQAAVRDFGDFLAPNIHPVFDRPDLGPADAATWTREQARSLANAAGRPVLVKETGFPHGGDPRFTVETQRQFWATYVSGPRLAKAGARWVSYAAAFEAFELPWKAAQTGMPIEEFWGFLSATRQPFPAFRVWTDLRAHG